MSGEVGVVAPTRRAHVFGHEPFSGTYRTKLEASGRLVLPAALRGPFATSAGAGHLFARRTDLIWLFTNQGFQVMVDDVIEKQGQGLVDPGLRNAFYGAAPAVVLDRQHRFVVPPELRGPIGLEGEVDVVLVGALERVEIWPAARFDAQAPAQADMLNRLLDGHGGLPTGTA